MAFQVTQCPSCESTFHANPKLLELAEGRVRCGACLTVFDAIDHFIAPENPEPDESDESVFVGNDPEDFFDPSVFLTRSALSQPDFEESFSRETFSAESPKHAESATTEPLSSLESKSEKTDETVDTSESTFADFIPAEEVVTTAFVEESGEESSSIDPDTFGASIEPTGTEVTEQEQSLDLFAANPAPENVTNAETAETFAEDEELLDFFTAVDESLEQLTNEDELSELEVLANLSVPSEQHDEEEIDHTDSNDLTTDPQEIEQDRTRQDQLGPRAVEASKPEDISLSVSFTLQAPGIRQAEPSAQHPTERIDEQEARPDVEQKEDTLASTDRLTNEEEHTFEQPVNSSSADDFGIAVKQAIEERDLEIAVQAGLATLYEPFEREPTEPGPQADLQPDTADLSGDATDEADLTAGLQAGESEDLASVEAATEPSELAGSSTRESDELSTEAIRARALEANLEDDEALETIPEESRSALKLMATPVELTGGSQSRWGRRIGMGILFVLLSGALAGQYFWQYRDDYSVDARFRTVYEQICIQLDCQLPEYSEIAAIRSDNLTVRSHPERDDALMVTVEIRNTADFEQRFPILILSFNNANDDTIALRELAPGEYLESGLRDFEFMPVLSPVQVTLPIVDPGPDAVNYTLAFRSP